MQPDAVRIATGQQSRSGSRADRLSDMEITKHATLRSQPVQVWSLKTPRSKHAHISIPLIVGKNDHDIRQLLSCILARQRVWSRQKKVGDDEAVDNVTIERKIAEFIFSADWLGSHRFGLARKRLLNALRGM